MGNGLAGGRDIIYFLNGVIFNFRINNENGEISRYFIDSAHEDKITKQQLITKLILTNTKEICSRGGTFWSVSILVKDI